MQYTQSPILDIVKHAYTSNEHPIIFALLNIIALILLAIAIHGAINWKSDDESKHFATIVASALFAIMLIIALIQLFNPNNRLGTYEGTVDIAFTSSLDKSNEKVAIFSDKDSDDSNIKSFTMNKKEMKALDIKSGKTVKIKATDKKAPTNNTEFIKLNKNDVTNVQDSSKIKDYNAEQKKAEQKDKKKSKKKDKKDKKKDD